MAKKCCSKNKDKSSINKISILEYTKNIEKLTIKLRHTYLKDKLLFSISKLSQVGVFANI